MNVIVKTAIAVFLCITLLVCVPAHAGGKKKMEPLYDLKSAESLRPMIYEATNDIYELFPVMRGDSIYPGTVSLNHAITVLGFNKNKLVREEFFHDVFDDLQLDSSVNVIPAVAPDVLGLGYKRRLIIFNLKKNIHKEFYITVSLEQSIRGIAVAEAQNRRFIFEINQYNKSSNDHNDYTTILRLMDLSGQEPKLINQIDIGKVTIWAFALGKNFLFDLDKEQLKVFNLNLESVNHPLVDAVNRNKGKVDFNRIYPNPYLSFAVFSGGEYGSMLLAWDVGRDKSPKHLIKGATEYVFSPDGKWLVFKREDYRNRREETYLMPVSEKYPYYLGTPILLRSDYFISKKVVWTTNPVSFVGADGKNIYRWELTKEAQRSMMGNDFDKYATFYDWIVAKDLEKLTKEKKQGLGK